MRSPATKRPEAARRNPLPVQNNLLAVRKTHTDSGSKSSAVGPASRGGSLRDVLGPSDYRSFASFLGPALRIRQDPPRFLVPDAPAGPGPALPRGLVVLLDRDRPIRQVRPREVGEVLAHREQLVLRVSEGREERLAGAGEELDVLPGVRCLVSLEELGDAHLPLGVAGPSVHQHVPHGFARFDREAALLQLLQGRCGRREDDVLRQGAGHALREDELVDWDRAVEDALRGPAEDVDGLRDALEELRRGRREAELPEHRLLADVDELRGVVLPEFDPAELELVVLEEAVVAVQRADAGRLARQEDDPLVAALEFDREADRSGDVLADLLDRIRVRLGPQPDGVDDAVDDLVPVGFRDLHRADEDVPRVRVDRLVAFDPAETGIFISLVSETRDEGPLENRVPPRVHILERSRFFLHLLLIPSSLDQRLQHAADDPDAAGAEMVPQLRDRQAIRRATGAVERLRGDVVLHHDARIEGGEVELVEAFVHPDLRLEGESAAISAQEILGVLEILRTILLPDY